TAAVIDRVLAQARPTVVCTHRPVLPTVIDSVRAAAAPGIDLELPREDPSLPAGEALVLHTSGAGRGVAIARHLPDIGCPRRRPGGAVGRGDDHAAGTL